MKISSISIQALTVTLLFLNSLSSVYSFNVNVNHVSHIAHQNSYIGRSTSITELGVIGSSTNKNQSTKTKIPPISTSTPSSVAVTSAQSSSTLSDASTATQTTDGEYNRGLAIIGFITLLFSSNSPILHAAFTNSSNPPSVLLLNAATSSIALMGLLIFGPVLNSIVPLPSTLTQEQEKQKDLESSTASSLSIDTVTTSTKDKKSLECMIAGAELGLWKTLGTTANLYGLSLTSSNHAAFLIQLTTLIVPSVQGLMGVPVPKRIWTSIVLALSGIYLFTQDMSGAGGADMLMSSTNTMLLGDALCVVAATFYATYDLRLFNYGKKVAPLPLIRTKISVQAFLSCAILSFFGEHGGLNEIGTYVQDLMTSSSDLLLVGSAMCWSGLIINAIVPFLQVSGQQMVGASRAQVVYASQPLWASILSFILLGETLGENGMKGGFLFLVAIFIAASAESPDADCGNDNCEV